MDARAWALLLAVTALALTTVAFSRQGLNAFKSRWHLVASVLIPIAIIIGTLPGFLQLSERARAAASVTSSIVSVIAVVLLVAHFAGKRKP
jgi:p-aminobenzoyl-glutamate transporter AbgT